MERDPFLYLAFAGVFLWRLKNEINTKIIFSDTAIFAA
jgi:hypothetical protein